MAALLDLVWSMPGYERLIGVWDFDGDGREPRAITWLMSLLTAAIDEDIHQPTPQARRPGPGNAVTG